MSRWRRFGCRLLSHPKFSVAGSGHFSSYELMIMVIIEQFTFNRKWNSRVLSIELHFGIIFQLICRSFKIKWLDTWWLFFFAPEIVYEMWNLTNYNVIRTRQYEFGFNQQLLFTTKHLLHSISFTLTVYELLDWLRCGTGLSTVLLFLYITKRVLFVCRAIDPTMLRTKKNNLTFTQ